VNAAEMTTGQTPLHYAVYEACVRAYDYVHMTLLDYGANPNVQNVDGDTPLHIAARLASVTKGFQEGSWEAANRLCRYGANPLIANKKGETPLSIVEEKVARNEPQEPVEPLEPKIQDFGGNIDAFRKALDDYPKMETRYYQEMMRFDERRRAFGETDASWVLLRLRDQAGIKDEESGEA
jgi:ankyrin repeat protein